MSKTIYITVCLSIAVLGILSLIFIKFLCVYEYIGVQDQNGTMTKEILDEDNATCYTLFQLIGEHKELDERAESRITQNQDKDYNVTSFNSSLLSSFDSSS